jgi:proton-translocating NAD(P)+ transhydrogenase subunit alpha
MIAIGVPAEDKDEPRIGMTPETVKKLAKVGAAVTVRSGAGLRSHSQTRTINRPGRRSLSQTKRPSLAPIS